MATTTQQNDLLNAVQPFLENEYNDAVVEAAAAVENTRYIDHVPITISHDDLTEFDANLAHDLLHQPSVVIDTIERAVMEHEAFVGVDTEPIKIQFTDVPLTSIRNITYEDLDSLISVKGVIRQATDPQPLFTEMAFECQRCGTLTRIPQSPDSVNKPHECTGCQRDGPFRVDTKQSEYVHHQKIRIQESPEGLRGGQDPRSLDIRIQGDNVDQASPGDQVTVTGILTHPDPLKTDMDNPSVTACLDENNIETESSAFSIENMTDEERKKIEEFGNRDDAAEAVVESIAPTIFGRETEKLAVALQMFSGVQKHVNDKTIRGDLHVFLVGDPGTAKSQLLHFANDVMPRSSFSTGEGSSKAGLTGAAVQSDLGDGSWSIEAGVLVLADTGIACVDELDKLDEGTDALHSALEQQEVNIAKAGINTTMNARCGLLAAANPKYGRFDRFESIPDQVDLPPALISRFDLIFTLKDDPDPDFDSNLAESILNTNHAGQKISAGDNPESVEELQEPEIPIELLPKYVMYARNEIDPVMTEAGKKKLQDFYVDMREKGVDDNAVPVTARKLEAMVRLAEASARMRLSDEITEEDTALAIDTVRESLKQVGVDPETGELDADMVESGMSNSQRNRVKTLKGIIEDIASQDEYDNGAPIEVVQEVTEENGIDPEKVEKELEKLKQKGMVYEPVNGHVRPT